MGNIELVHWGVPGMKWGVRRYQNKDGTLTAAGKKRYDKEMAKLKAEKKILDNKAKTKAKLDKLENLRKEVETGKQADRTAKTTQKTTKVKKREMTDEELREKVQRLELEKRYRDLMKEKVSSQNKPSKGTEFVKKTLSKTAEDMAPQVTKYFAAKMINKVLGEEGVFANNKKKS